jgi:hypothetical protein
MRNLETIKKYLPSKRFVLIFSTILILILLYIGISSFIRTNKTKKETKKETIERLTGLTVADLVSQDTDGDNVTDWEESLWGTDKNNKFTFDGILDSEYINRKKQELNIENKIDESNLSETDKFAREFFSAFMAMKESGVDDTTINNFASSLGQKIITTESDNEFKEEDVLYIKNETLKDVVNYYNQLQKIFNKYSIIGFGDEVLLLEKNLNNYSATGVDQNTEEVTSIGIAYQEFAKDIIKIKTPESLKEFHLLIANSAYRTGTSVLGMAKVINDPIFGITGISQYQKYSAEFIANVQSLETFLQENGIIST